MNGYLLDTNIPSELVRPQPEPLVAEWVYAEDEQSLFLSVVTIGELRRGFTTLAAGKRRVELEEWFEDGLLPSFAGRILPVTQAIAERWGVLDSVRQKMGMPLNTADGMIAATALEHQLVLVTRNVKDFVETGADVHNPWDTRA